MIEVMHEPTTPRVFARWCSWHNGPMTPKDAELAEDGAPITHSICADCAAKHFPATTGGGA